MSQIVRNGKLLAFGSI